MPRVIKPEELAANGGRPVNNRPWRTGKFHFPQEITALRKVLSGPALPLAGGDAVTAFRRQVQEAYGVKHAIPVSSGTTAIHVALHAAGVGAGDEVIVSPLTDYGSIIGILQLNAIPVFADVEPEGLLMDVRSVGEKITAHTKAIIPVHNGGYAVDMRELIEVAREHKVTIVEDCAQSHMASIDGQFLGTFGEIGAFSINDSKHMKAGEGGFVITNDDEMALAADQFTDKSYNRAPDRPAGVSGSPSIPALNARMSEITAAVASVQLEMLPGWIEKRQAFGDAFHEGIQDVPGITPYPQPAGARPSYWWTLFSVDEEVLGVDAEGFCEMLDAEGIPARSGPQRYIPGWEVFRQLNIDPEAHSSYRPGRLRKGAYPLDVAPNAVFCAQRVAAISITQYNTVREARAAARAIRKVSSALTGAAR